jgi:hypothetical protein
MRSIAAFDRNRLTKLKPAAIAASLANVSSKKKTEYRRSALGARRSALGARRSALGARRSALGARRSALGARRSALECSDSFWLKEANIGAILASSSRKPLPPLHS